MGRRMLPFNVGGESVHFKEDVHPVDNICARSGKGFSFLVTQEYSNG